MPKRKLDRNEINAFLSKAQVGRISTINADGFPYTVPVHFVHVGDSIFIHNLLKGQKIDNLKANKKVCFEADEMSSLYYKADIKTSCNVGTNYMSVIAFGEATLIEDAVKKREVLNLIVEKYTPEFVKLPMPEEKIAITGIIEINILNMSGKTIEKEAFY